MATITRQDRHLPNLSRGQSTLEATDYVILEGGSSISYADLITMLNADLTVSGNPIIKEQITTASTIGTASGTTYYYFCLTGDSYYLPVTADNNCVYNFKNDGSDYLYILADSGAGDTIEVEERGEITIGTELRVPPYESRCIAAFESTWRIF